jgi:hypothetical protein
MVYGCEDSSIPDSSGDLRSFVYAGSKCTGPRNHLYGNSQCKICHSKKEEGEQWNKWKAEDHAKAFARLSSDEAKAAGQKKGLAKPPAET